MNGYPTAIASWAKLNERWLRKHLALPNGIPGKDTFRRVLGLLNPAAFQQCFQEWLESFSTPVDGAPGDKMHIAIDGKTMRRSHDRKNGLGPMHIVSAWASDRGITLGQVATEEKSNEITAIPQLLDLIDVEDAIVTIDAAGCQKNISSAPGGFIEHDLLRAKPQASGRVAFTLPVRRPGRYDVALRWINQISSPIRYARDVRVEVVHAEGTSQLSIDQQRGGGQWNRLGAYRFEPESEAKVIVSTEGASGHVQADAVRLTRTRRTPR